MDNYLFDWLKSCMCLEVSNQLEFCENNIRIILINGKTIEISIINLIK